MSENKKIIIRGARQNNLKNITVELPRDKLIVITGVSGSGKSSLAFETLYAEGQRRYVESLSAYARQFLSVMEKPDVDSIEGLSPAIAIQQRGMSHNPRSTVATMTEIHDYLRLLFARIGEPHCPTCKRPIAGSTVQEIVDRVLDLPQGHRIIILSPVVRGRKGEYQKVFKNIVSQGFLRVRVDGEFHEATESFTLDKNKKHDIEIVVDRLIVDEKYRSRLADSIETALKFGDGLVIVHDDTTKEEFIYSENFSCPVCGISYEELSPRMFSFNNPYGACPRCGGLGTETRIDPQLVVPDPDLSIINGAIVPWGDVIGKWVYAELKALARAYGFSLHEPFRKLPEEVKEIILYGTGSREISVHYESARKNDFKVEYSAPFEGVIPWLERRYKQTDSVGVRIWIERFMSRSVCPACNGMRLKPESLSVLIDGYSIGDICRLSVNDAYEFVKELPEKLSEKKKTIAKQILKELASRLGFLLDVGVGYITLDRETASLSGGEAQRIHLATQIGSKLVGVLYILDEPSIGLHARDNLKLLATLKSLRDLGNTIVVIEHDRETIEHADFVCDLGPGAGESGGHLVFAGTTQELKKSQTSLTGAYLSGRKRIEIPQRRRKGNGLKLVIEGCTGNNLKDITVEFPLGTFICVTGVSGSGKSSLIDETLYPILARHYHRSLLLPLPYRRVRGLEYLDKVINIDQSPIGRTPRSNPATYTGVFTPIRELFAALPESRARGYTQGRFSFNVKGGRCEACQGAGVIKLEMHFLPDVYVTCDVCKGKRYDRETLQIQYKGKNIYDVLNMTVNEAHEFFKNIPKIREKLELIQQVGLGYIRLGQPATTLSGGEAQRVKLSLELSRHDTGRTLYILDEPTVGLHPDDIRLLLQVLHKLVDKGNTVIVIEHNLDVIKTADWIIDMGPEGGDEGGRVIAVGTPEQIIESPVSYTGRFLKKELERFGAVEKARIKR